MRVFLKFRFWPTIAIIAALGVTAGMAHAHEQRGVEDYRFVVGFAIEPAFEGERNGVYLRVTRVTKAAHEESEEHDPRGHEDNGNDGDNGEDTPIHKDEGTLGMADGAGEEVPVEGLEETLQVEVTYVPTGASKVMSLRAVFGDPGSYTADIVPTAPGHYRFRFFGAIEGIEVDQTFDSISGGGGFDDVRPSGEFHFPDRLPEVREIESAVRGAQNTAQQAQDTALRIEDAALEARDDASSAGTLAIVGIVLGVVGIAAGAAGGAAALAALRRR